MKNIFNDKALKVDEKIVKIFLKEGKNQILLKVINRVNNWEACLRVCDARAVPIDISDYL